MAENNVRSGMRDITDQVNTWSAFKYADSGLVEDFAGLDQIEKERRIRAIVFARIPGTAINMQGKEITIGRANTDDTFAGVRFYSDTELKNFSIKFLRELAESEAHKIDITGKNVTQLADAILLSQRKIQEASMLNDPTL